MPKSSFAPFASDPEYLEAEFGWLRARSRWLVAEREARQAKERECDGPVRPGRTSAREARLQGIAAHETESRRRHENDARLHAHRRAGKVQLGLDVLAAKHSLTEAERTVLLICAVTAFGQRFTDQVLTEFNSFCSGVSVQDCIDLLAPESLGDRLKLRFIFTNDGKLVKEGLIELGSAGKFISPSTLAGQEVTLTLPTFAVIVGDPNAANAEPEVES